MEAYNDSFYTTGVTYQADNQPTPTTVKGAGRRRQRAADHRPRGRMDWGVHAYDPTGANGIDPRNGGIVGTVSYDTTRNELDPQYAASEDWQPGVSGPAGRAVRDGRLRRPRGRALRRRRAATSSHPTAPTPRASCSTPTLTEHWSRPTGCVARDVDGVPLAHGTDENVLAMDATAPGDLRAERVHLEPSSRASSSRRTRPIRALPTRTSARPSTATTASVTAASTASSIADDPPRRSASAATFDPARCAPTTSCTWRSPTTPTATRSTRSTREEDINIGNGDQIVPQVPPPACAGPLHTVDLAGDAGRLPRDRRRRPAPTTSRSA